MSNKRHRMLKRKFKRTLLNLPRRLLVERGRHWMAVGGDGDGAVIWGEIYTPRLPLHGEKQPP